MAQFNLLSYYLFLLVFFSSFHNLMFFLFFPSFVHPSSKAQAKLISLRALLLSGYYMWCRSRQVAGVPFFARRYFLHALLNIPWLHLVFVYDQARQPPHLLQLFGYLFLWFFFYFNFKHQEEQKWRSSVQEIFISYFLVPHSLTIMTLITIPFCIGVQGL